MLLGFCSKFRGGGGGSHHSKPDFLVYVWRELVSVMSLLGMGEIYVISVSEINLKACRKHLEFYLYQQKHFRLLQLNFI